MKSRLFSTLVIWLAVGAALYFGKVWGGLALLLLVSTAAHWEFCKLLTRCGGHPRVAATVTTGFLLTAVLSYSLLTNGGATQDEHGLVVALPGLFIGAISLVLLLTGPARLVSFFNVSPTALSWLYIPCSMLPAATLAAELWAKGHDIGGLLLVFWIVATVKFADCGALLVGLSFGEKRHRMAPTVSPGKSWEGCVGGIIVSVAVAAGVAWLFAHFRTELGWRYAASFSPERAALLALPLAILSIPSDLIESVFKRKAGVKDSGKTIPGIGGAFDLLDSLVLTVPVAYVLIKIFVLA
jgi:phosphatidate cytidylyltransferase